MESFTLFDWGLLVTFLLVLAGFAGFMAGLLGVGGGLILVPGFFFVFKLLGFEGANIMHLAVGTSMAIIVPTGISSSYAHYKKDSIRFDLVRKLGIGVIIGVIIGTIIADHVSGQSLLMFFACALFVLAALLNINPEKIQSRYDMLRQPWPAVVGSGVGTVSSLMGIGGAVMNVPFMVLNGVSIHKAVGTASAIGPVIALPTAIGFCIIGWGEEGLPPLSFGYVNVLAMAIIIPVSVAIAPLGAKVAHSISVKRLRKVFAGFIVLVALKMLYEAVYA